MAAPVLGFYTEAGSPVTLSSLNFTGSGAGGAVVVGASSTIAQFRIYNNKANAGGVGDALSCVVSCYDSAVTPGGAASEYVSNLWVHVRQNAYDTTFNTASSVLVPIGGLTKYALPLNGATIAGAAPHYAGIDIQLVVPLSTSQTSVSAGVYLEYSYT